MIETERVPGPKPNSVPTKAAMSPWWARVLLVVLLGGAIWVLVTWAIGDPWAFAGYAAAAVVLGGVGVLSVRSRRVSEWMDAAFRGYFRITAWFAAVWLPIVVARALSEVVARSSFAIAVLVLFTWLAVFGLLVGALSTEARRRRIWKSLSRVGPAAPFVYTLVVAQIAIILFATLAFVLAEREAIEFGTRDAVVHIAEPVDALDFFAWHALDSIPALEITGTLRWDEPLGYDNAGVGLLLLVFKVAVIAPIVAAFVSFWRYRHESDDRPALPAGEDGTGAATDRH